MRWLQYKIPYSIFGPDHYLPFIVMSKSGKWSLRKTILITFLCGVGHVLSSVLLGFIGIAFGLTVTRLEAVESCRGNLAAWALIAFGIVYCIWGIRQAVRNKPHQHLHTHSGGVLHEHTHGHKDAHVHAHNENNTRNLTPWVLFTIFVLGPCEPLIPLLMYPAAKSNLYSVLYVGTVFGSVTIATMMSIVLFSRYSMSFVPMAKLERYTHALAGGTILLCGLSIQFLGL